jgi:outer membrane PBP1 activator LpoA protein
MGGYLHNHLALAYLAGGETPQAHAVLEKIPETMEGGTVAMDTRLVEALLAAAGQRQQAQKRLKALEEEAASRTLFLYSQAARRLRLALKKGTDISKCVQLI